MICEMKEVVLQGEDYESSTTDNEPSEPTEDEKEDREDVIQEEDSPAPIEPLPATPFTNERTRKVDILRTYL